jgi:hypothetical protein
MRKQIFYAVLFLSVTFSNLSCQKENIPMPDEQSTAASESTQNLRTAPPPFNLEVVLRGAGKSFGLVKFRQDVDPAKIITIDTWVRGLASNHEYKLQRAVDMINVVDGNCTSATWLTLGKGLVAQSIFTDNDGTGREYLWRSVAALPAGSMFDIHFRVIDATTNAVVLTSDCYQYTVR